jgi:hypothetical protein
MDCQRDKAQLFPMRDEASAQLMMVKAECLYSAGIISDAEKLSVFDEAKNLIRRSERERRPQQHGRFPRVYRASSDEVWIKRQETAGRADYSF